MNLPAPSPGSPAPNARQDLSDGPSAAAGGLAGRNILLGVTGGVAAYKAALLVRDLQRAGASVQAVLTEAATHFVTPTTFQALTGKPVVHHDRDVDPAFRLPSLPGARQVLVHEQHEVVLVGAKAASRAQPPFGVDRDDER